MKEALPPGWIFTETIHERRYVFQERVSSVTVQKDTTADKGRLDIFVHSYRTWSGYEGPDARYRTVMDAMRIAEETLANPRSHLSQYGVEKLLAARAKQASVAKAASL